MAREDRFSRSTITRRSRSAVSRRGVPRVEGKLLARARQGRHARRCRLRVLAQNARVNVAAAALLAMAPPAPRVVSEKGQPLIGRQPSGYDANLRWLASPGASGYRIYRREPWAQAWESSEEAGNVTQFVVQGASIDDWVLGCGGGTRRAGEFDQRLGPTVQGGRGHKVCRNRPRRHGDTKNQ